MAVQEAEAGGKHRQPTAEYVPASCSWMNLRPNAENGCASVKDLALRPDANRMLTIQTKQLCDSQRLKTCAVAVAGCSKAVPGPQPAERCVPFAVRGASSCPRSRRGPFFSPHDS